MAKYIMRPQEEREKIAQSCLNGQNANRVSYAMDIRNGDLFNSFGELKSYWHLLATYAPNVPLMRRGRWAPAEYRDGPGWVWEWSDWGPLR